MSWNDDLLRFINEDMANPGLDVFFSILIILGTVYVWLVLVPALWWKGKRNEAVDLFFLIVLVLVVTTLLKFLFASPRPEDIREVPIPVPGYFGFDVYSFPSNHASRAFACAVFLSFRFKKWTVPLFVYAFLIGLAKIYVGAHYPGDIIAGAAIGIAFGLAVVWLGGNKSYVSRRKRLVTWVERFPNGGSLNSRRPPPLKLKKLEDKWRDYSKRPLPKPDEFGIDDEQIWDVFHEIAELDHDVRVQVVDVIEGRNIIGFGLDNNILEKANLLLKMKPQHSELLGIYKEEVESLDELLKLAVDISELRRRKGGKGSR
jgi:undecaprenyl-diphosphatase